jgi:hypothetical protein
MVGFLHKARHYLFGYDAIESKNQRQFDSENPYL